MSQRGKQGQPCPLQEVAGDTQATAGMLLWALVREPADGHAQPYACIFRPDKRYMNIHKHVWVAPSAST